MDEMQLRRKGSEVVKSKSESESGRSRRSERACFGVLDEVRE